jgi:phytanoyl-CoA hydroxylase
MTVSAVVDVDRFEREGYLVVPGLGDRQLVDRMRRVALRDVAEDCPPIEYEAELRYPGAPKSLEAEGGRTARRLKNAVTRSPLFVEWLLRTEVLERLRALVGPRVVCPLAHHNCVMTKQPRYSSETGWHQDIRYWSYERPELVNLWLALGREYPENGGLWVIPGSHRMTIVPDQYDAAKFFREDLPANQPILATKQAVRLEPGDVLFFHCKTLHAASRNETTEPKLSAVFTFRAADNPPLAGTRSAASPELLLTPGA